MKKAISTSLLVAGLFLSGTHAAYTWKPLPVGGGGFVSGIVASRQVPNLLYARTDVGGAYRWNQTAGAWESITDWSLDAGDQGVSAVALDPQDPNRLYLLTGISYFNNGRSWLLRSTDRGATFEKIEVTSAFRVNGNGGGRHLGSRLAVDPNLPSRLIAGSGSSNNGAFFSSDRGTTWTQIAGVDKDCAVSFVAYDSASSAKGSPTKIIYVGLTRSGNRNLFRSTDAGATWSVITSMSSLVPQRGIVTENGTLLVTYADKPVLEQSGTGAVWKFSRAGVATNITPANATNAWSGIDAMPGNGNRLIISSINNYSTPQCWASSTCTWSTAAWGDVVLTSDNQGASWTNQVTGINHPSGKTVKLVSETAGPTWAEKANGNIHWTGNVTFDPFDANRAFVTSGQGVFRASGLTTNTVNWNFSSKGIEELVTNEFVAVPGGTKLSAVWDYDGVRWPSNGGYAPSKFQPSRGHNISLTVALGAPKWVARLGNGSNDILVSSDSGKTWVSKPRPSNTTNGQVLFNRNGTSLLLAVGSSAWISRDQGATWAAVSWPNSTGGMLTADAVYPNLVYMYGNDRKLWVSINGGASFSANATLPTAWNSSPRLAPTLGRGGDIWFAAGQGADNSSKLIRYLIQPTTGAVTQSTTYKTGNWWEYITQVGTGKAAPGHSYPALYAWGNFGGTIGVFRSDDTGTTWARINDDKHQFGGPGNGQFIYGDPDVYGRVYMGTFGRGVVVGDIVNQAPTASLALSATSMTNTGSIKATVTGTDLDGKISKLTLLVDGKVYATATASPWVAVLSGLTKGAHSVQAIATDNNGAIGGSAAKTISVVWNYALVVNASTKSNWFGGLIVNYSLPTPLPATTLQLLDASGTVRKSVSLTAGSVRTRFTAVSGYPAGNYTLRIVSNGAIVATRTFAKL